jgi:hypothetical protein
MVEAWRGTLDVLSDARQGQLFDALNVNGLCPLDGAATLLPNEGCGELDVDDALRPYTLAGIIRAGRRAIVTCWPSELGQVLRTRRLSSPHGPLPDGTLPHHALYVFGVSEEGFDAFDPWHTATGQPLRLTREELVRAWTGMMLIATK